MPLTLLDIGLLVVMLISGILAMVRGFMREILSIAAWVIAAGVTLYGYARAETYVKQYVTNDLVAKAIAIGGLFLLVRGMAATKLKRGRAAGPRFLVGHPIPRFGM